MLIPLITSGIYLLTTTRNPRILMAAIFMMAFTAVAPVSGNADQLFFTSLYGECLMFFCIAIKIS